MDHPDLTVSNFMENNISLKKIKGVLCACAITTITLCIFFSSHHEQNIQTLSEKAVAEAQAHKRTKGARKCDTCTDTHTDVHTHTHGFKIRVHN